MVTRAFIVLAVITIALLSACGGKSSDSKTIAPTRVSGSSATATPRGPSISLDPRQGPPATEITVTGSGWPAGMTVDITGEVADGTNAKPYATARTSASGSFQAQFRLEKSPTGETLAVGPFQVVARSGNITAEAAFQVQTARPVPVPGGG